jgi:hypothetical protein
MLRASWCGRGWHHGRGLAVRVLRWAGRRGGGKSLELRAIVGVVTGVFVGARGVGAGVPAAASRCTGCRRARAASPRTRRTCARARASRAASRARSPSQDVAHGRVHPRRMMRRGGMPTRQRASRGAAECGRGRARACAIGTTNFPRGQGSVFVEVTRPSRRMTRWPACIVLASVRPGLRVVNGRGDGRLWRDLNASERGVAQLRRATGVDHGTARTQAGAG